MVTIMAGHPLDERFLRAPEVARILAVSHVEYANYRGGRAMGVPNLSMDLSNCHF